MHDIYLADVSDRNNYIGSIFSAVIDVPSFLTDYAGREGKADMTSLTEEFVCRRLFPRDYDEGDGAYNLAEYRKYLIKTKYRKDPKSDELKVWDERELHKILAVLQQCVVYLAHVSKGAPKKISQLFESFIEIDETDRGEEETNIVVRNYRRSKFFLAFGYQRQFTVGFLAYLVTPIFYRLVDRNISRHNDKLLVSALRFVDFLFKFHKHSFSWRHLDISPEMLVADRAPELKQITADLLNLISQRFIIKSNFSLFDYRFDNRIANEVFAAAKTNEMLSALFSFSLDESLSLKEHYKSLLAKTMAEYKTEKSRPGEDVIDAVSSLQIVLGDLHYFDDELEVAGIYYRDAIEALRKKGSRSDYDKDKSRTPDNEEQRILSGEFETMKPEQLYIFVRNMLKVGMIYETRKQYEQAYLIYGEVCTRVVRERDIAIRELGAGLAIRKDCHGKTIFVKTSACHGIGKEKEMYNDNVDYPTTATEECGDAVVDREIAQPQPLYFKKLSPNTNDMLFRKMTYEGLKMLYLPFLAKLQILEKSHLGGIARTHLEQMEKEMEHLTFIIDHQEAYILKADFYSRVADILYYKNADLKDKEGWNRIEDADADKYNDLRKDEDSGEKKANARPKNRSCTACHYYHNALATLLHKDKVSQEQNDRAVCGTIKNSRDEYSKLECAIREKKSLKYGINEIKSQNGVKALLRECAEIISDDEKDYNVKFCTVAARILSDWGNVFLSCDKAQKPESADDKTALDASQSDGKNKEKDCFIGDKHIHDEKDWETDPKLRVLCFDYVNPDRTKKGKKGLLEALKNGRDDFSKQEIAFMMYAMSFRAFGKADSDSRAAYQLYKMLRLIKRYGLDGCDEAIKTLSRNAVSLLWSAADELNALELNKRKMDINQMMGDEKKPLPYLLVDSEIAVMAILVQELNLNAAHREGGEELVKTLKKMYNLHVTSQYGMVYSFSARIFQLRLKAEINLVAYSLLVPEVTFGKLNEEIDFILKEEAEKQKNKEASYEENKEKNATLVQDMFKEIYGKNGKDIIFAELVCESISCLKDLLRLAETLDENYLFNHSFMGSVYERLAFWTERYEACRDRTGKVRDAVMDRMGKRFRKVLADVKWEKQLSSHYELRQALSHYRKCLETHSEGNAYHTLIDNMYFVKDDYNDRSDHFSLAIERHKINNGETDEKKIEILKNNEDIKIKVARLKKESLKWNSVEYEPYNTENYFVK